MNHVNHANGWSDPVGLLDINVDDHAHILIKDQDACGSRSQCENKPCTFICPAEVYKWDREKSEVTINYSRCIECYACVLVCPRNNIEWDYPRGGFGVAYRF